MVSCSKGHSAIAVAAALSGSRLRDERLGTITNSARKHGVMYTEIMAPADAPGWMRDRGCLWNAAETAGRRKNIQVARQVRMALPCKLTLAQQCEVMQTFVADQFVAVGIVSDVAVHNSQTKNSYGRVLPLLGSGYPTQLLHQFLESTPPDTKCAVWSSEKRGMGIASLKSKSGHDSTCFIMSK